MKNRTLSASALICATLLSSVAHAQSLWSIALVAGTNAGDPGSLHAMDSQSSTTGALSQAVTNSSFTGLDRANATQTMNFQAVNRASAEYGRLHIYSSASLTNSYYNANNPTYYDFATQQLNPGGSPSTLCSLGFAGFDDTLHFGGNLQSGYTARYIFRAEGTNSGSGPLADLAVGIAGNPDESFFATWNGYSSEIWATQSYAISGTAAQSVHVQFSNQVVFDTDLYADGSNLTGLSDFSATLTLTEVQIFNASGQQVFDVSATSDSGTIYQTPEPVSMITLGLGLAGMLRRRKARTQ